MDLSVFDDITTALLGETVIQVPRVSRETIISVLQSHTNLIRSMKVDHAKLASKVAVIESETKKNSSDIQVLNDNLEESNKNVKELFRLSREFRQEMDELSEKVAELHLLKKQIGEQKEFIENLASRYEQFSAEVGAFMSETGRIIVEVDQSCKDTLFQLQELRNYVDHFADNLVLSSGQITVETDAGFNVRPTSLTDTLKQCSNTLNEFQETGVVVEGKITQIFKDLDTKAPDTVLFNVNTLERKVATIEMHLRKEEEQGIGAIRRTCDELAMTVQTMVLEMSEKIDRETAGFIVHEKYEEIVRYLQDALQSSLEDETRFKQKADEIQEMVILLTNSKADRTEIQAMQELMVKSEALLKKVGANINIKDRLKDLVSRKELDAVLELKVDKVEMEQQMASVLANAKRTRKLTSVLQPAAIEDALNNIQFPTSAKSIIGALPKSSLEQLHDQRIPGGSAPPSAEERNNAIIMQMTALSGEYDEDSASGKRHNLTSAKAPVIAIGRAIVPNVSPGRSKHNGEDFSNYVKNKQKNPVTSTSLPSSAPPGSFRPGSEAGRAGGTPSQGFDLMQGSIADHMTFLKGPIVGGGFNAQSRDIKRATPAANPAVAEDVEGKGLMIKGDDGHFYYKDIHQKM